MILYPDVNVLIALFDTAHQHHNMASTAFVEHNSEGWASCPVVETGFIRVISNPSYTNSVSVANAVSLLQIAISNTQHHNLHQSISILNNDCFQTAHLVSHKQLTDLYLIGMAIYHNVKLITFDRNIPTHAAIGFEPKHLLVL